MKVSHLSGCLSIAALVVLLAPSDLLAQGQGRIRGQVLNDDTDEPIAGATVVAELPDGNRPPVETQTDEDGRFQVIGLTSGQWQATVTKDGFSDTGGGVRVTQGDAAPVTFYLRRERSALEVALGDEALEGLDAEQLEADLRAADAAYNADDYETAIAGYRALLDTLPQMSNLYLQIGNAYRAMNQFDEAIAAYEELQVIDPENRQVETEIARTRLAMGDLDAAAGLAENISLDSSREDLYNLGELEFAKGNIEVASGWYEKAAAADPSWELPWFKLALVALNQGDIDTAKQHFQKVVELAPDSESGAQAQATLAALP